jgi:hypothetical protein
VFKEPDQRADTLLALLAEGLLLLDRCADVLEECGMETARIKLSNFVSTFSDRGPSIKSMNLRLKAQTNLCIQIVCYELLHRVHLIDKGISAAQGWGPSSAANRFDDAHWSALQSYNVVASHAGFVGWCRGKYGCIPRWIVRCKANRFGSVAAGAYTLITPMGRGVVSARTAIADWVEAFGMDARDAKRARQLVHHLRDFVVEAKLLIVATIFVKVTYPLTRRFLTIVSCAEVPPLLLRARKGVAAVRALPSGAKVEWLLRRRGKQGRRGISLSPPGTPGARSPGRAGDCP